MASPTLQYNLYDFNVAFYVFVLLLIVKNLLHYVFNDHIFRSTINREGSCTMDLLVLFLDIG